MTSPSPSQLRQNNGQPRTLGIILARAGSKGLPHKNALPVAGKPMAAWTIEHAGRSGRLRNIVVSTDSDAVAQVAKEAQVDVIDRPADLAHDTATVDAAARHALQWCEMRYEVTFPYIVIYYANVPLRPGDLTQRAVDKLIATGCDSVQSVTPVAKMHPYWMKTLGTDPDAPRTEDAQADRLLMYQDNHVYRRQDLPPVYMLDGGIIAVTRQSLLTVRAGEPHAFLGTDRRAVVNGTGEVVDVDDLHDLIVAEAILKHRNHPSQSTSLEPTG